MSEKELKYLEDYYLSPDGKMVFTEAFHLKRGYCCGSGCFHCPYDGIEAIDGQPDSNEFPVQCPFCHETFFIPMFQEEGEAQAFVYDCEICCNPIHVSVHFDENNRPVIQGDRS